MSLGNHNTLSLWSPQGKDPIKELWVAVLARAIHDAFGQNDYVEARKSLAWLKSKRADFQQVCEYAGRDPDYVHKKLTKPLNEREKYFENLRNDPFTTQTQSDLFGV